MSWRIVFVDTDGRELLGSRYVGLDDAAGDLDGGDAIGDLLKKYGTKKSSPATNTEE